MTAFDSRYCENYTVHLSNSLLSQNIFSLKVTWLVTGNIDWENPLERTLSENQKWDVNDK